MIFWSSFDWMLKIYLKRVSSSYYAKVCSLERGKNYNSTHSRLHKTLIPKQSWCCRQCCRPLLRHLRPQGCLTLRAGLPPHLLTKGSRRTLPTHFQWGKWFLLPGDVAIGNCPGRTLLLLPSPDFHSHALDQWDDWRLHGEGALPTSTHSPVDIS